MGNFTQPPKGPEIGPEKKPADLPEEKQRELGDFAKLTEPLKEDTLASAEEQAAAKIEDLPPAPAPDNSDEGVERLEALQSVLTAAQEAPPDPEEVAIEEAAEPTIEDRQEFLRCMLGNKSYSKTVELFGGALTLEMADLMPSEVDTIYKQLAVDQTGGKVETVDDWNIALDRYRMLCMTEKLICGDIVVAPHELSKSRTGPQWVERIEELLSKLKSTVTYRAWLRATRIFQRHLDKLVTGAMDPDFWEGGGSDLPSEPTSEEPSTTEKSLG